MNIKHRFFALLKDYLTTHAHALTLVVLVLFLPLIYMLVYFTGGIKYVYSHTMYIPILLAGILIGPKSGFMIALFAGILLGPLMPIDTETGEMQETFNWIYRLITFMLIGIISGIASKKIKDDGKAIQNLMSHNQETHIPNTNYLSYAESHLKDGSFTISTLMIHNHYNIKDVLGVDIYPFNAF